MVGSLQERYSVRTKHEEKWKRVVADTISMLDAVLSIAAEEAESDQSFEDHVRAHMVQDSFSSNYYESPGSDRGDASPSPRFDPPRAAARLEIILRDKLPQYNHASRATLRANRRPSRLVRYWVPGLLLLVG